MYQVFDEWTCEELNNLYDIVFEKGFTYQITPTVVPGINSLAHPIQSRIENSDGIPQVYSHLYHFILKILYRFCFDHSIHFNTVCRSVINYTHPSAGAEYPKHKDHEYDHLLLIFYLNDSDGDTLIYDEKDNLVASITPKKGRILLVDGKVKHAVNPPTEKERLVLITTIA